MKNDERRTWHFGHVALGCALALGATGCDEEAPPTPDACTTCGDSLQDGGAATSGNGAATSGGAGTATTSGVGAPTTTGGAGAPTTTGGAGAPTTTGTGVGTDTGTSGGDTPTTTGGGDASGTTGAEAGGSTDVQPIEENLKCYEFLAHAPGNNDAPYQVGAVRDSYVNFTFNSPWDQESYGRRFTIMLDNMQVVHHWLLYQNSGPGIDGGVEPSSGAHPTGELMYGWAPGGNSLNFAEFGDIGMIMNAGVSYTLELHYNSSDPGAADHSGVEICVSDREPAEKAATSWLGTDAIFGTEATGTCNPKATEPIRLLGISPHMHTKGKHMKAVINRAGGTPEVLHDKPFDFNYQTYYFVDTMLMPGDTITTTCQFSGFSTFGESTDAEMCYMFTVHTPAGALADGDPWGAVAHGKNSCLGTIPL